MSPSAPPGSSAKLQTYAAAFGGLFAAIVVPSLILRPPPPHTLFAMLVLGGFLALLAAYDLDQFRLPDWLTLPLLALGLVFALLDNVVSAQRHAVAVLLAGAGLWLFGRLYHALRGREGLGLGDVKLFAALGAWVGLGDLLVVLLIACLSALFVITIARSAGRDIDAATPVPFGVFLALGGWTTWLYGPFD